MEELKGLFPSASDDRIRSALHLCNGNVDSTVELLLQEHKGAAAADMELENGQPVFDHAEKRRRKSSPEPATADDGASAAAAAAATVEEETSETPTTHPPSPEILSRVPPEQIRWFWKDVPTARTWRPFCTHDSLIIEAAFREWAFDPTTKPEVIPVRGGMYDVDLMTRQVLPAFWKDHALPVTRGCWFYEGSAKAAPTPLPEQISDQMEKIHCSPTPPWMVAATSVTAMRTTGTGSTPTTPAAKATPKREAHLLRVDIAKHVVFWFSEHEVHVSKPSATNSVTRSLSRRPGERVCRGYTAARTGLIDESGAMGEDDCRCGVVRHLVLVAHGIGQKSYVENREENIVGTTEKLRTAIEQVLKEGKCDDRLRSGSYRVEFVPIEWRTSLPVDEDTVDDITLPNLESVRSMLNATVLDVLYFTSPRYRQGFVDTLSHATNAVYHKFVQRHPDFEKTGGRVSLIGHSLGGVLFFEMVKNQHLAIRKHSVQEELDESDANEVRHLEAQLKVLKDRVAKRQSGEIAPEETVMPELTPPELHNVSYRKFPFKPDILFTFGSPVSVFLSLKGASSTPGAGVHGHSALLPSDTRVYNIYNPLDPVAYRLEPLLFRPVQDPVLIPKHQSASLQSTLKRMHKVASLATAWFSSKRTSSDADDELNVDDIQVEPPSPRVVFSSESGMLTPDRIIEQDGDRMDFAMQTRSLHELMGAIGAHSSYWTSLDCALFVAQRLRVDKT